MLDFDWGVLVRNGKVDVISRTFTGTVMKPRSEPPKIYNQTHACVAQPESEDAPAALPHATSGRPGIFFRQGVVLRRAFAACATSTHARACSREEEEGDCNYCAKAPARVKNNALKQEREEQGRA